MTCRPLLLHLLCHDPPITIAGAPVFDIDGMNHSGSIEWIGVVIVGFVLRIRSISHEHAPKAARDLALYFQVRVITFVKDGLKGAAESRIVAGPGLDVRPMTLEGPLPRLHVARRSRCYRPLPHC